MTFDYELTLIKNTYSTNDMGDAIPRPVERPVLASLIDYRSKEFYQAMANGLKPEKTFAINKFEYDGEEEVRFNGTPYKIVDLFPVKMKDASEFETIALICSGLVNGAV